MNWTAERIARALELPAPSGSAETFTGVFTDTRHLIPGAIFVALEGERFDGHDFLRDATRHGARAAVVRFGTPSVPGLTLFHVPDTLTALGRLARVRREEVTGPVVAVTGTNGKTSTRVMLEAVLARRYRVHATRANLNNRVGVPLTILGAPMDTEALVVEAGASEPGEIAALRDVIAPTLAVVTSVAAGHLEGFGTLEGVLREKTALLLDVPLAVVASEPPGLPELARTLAAEVVTAGRDSGDLVPEAWSLDATGHAVVTVGGASGRLGAPGPRQVANAMVALAVARHLGIGLADALPALADLSLPAGRTAIHHAGERLVIDDTYNANPESVGAALDLAAALRGSRPLVLVLGTMRELGSDAERLHRECAELALALDPDLFIAVGDFGPACAALGPGDPRIVAVPDAEAAGEVLRERAPQNALVLLKASRGVRLERALPTLIDQDGP